MIEVLKPGLHTLIQDCGRKEFQSFGVPVSGAMDSDASLFANYLVGNTADEAVLEITLIGPSLKFKVPTFIAITGASMQPKINGKAVEMYKTLKIEKGAVLTFGKLEFGCRTYVAVSGGISVEKVMGSRSTYTYASLGGLNGRALLKGDILPIDAAENCIEKSVPKEFQLHYTRLLPVRIVKGIEFDWFKEISIQQFLTQEYKIKRESNRMGYRLEGPILKLIEKKELISSAVLKGTVQISNDGKPIILLADAQTIGGYPRIAQVISADIAAIGQQKPGDKIRFRLVDLNEVQFLWKQKQKRLEMFFSERIISE